jgi:acyl dehydratase
MALDHSLIGVPSKPHQRSWTSADALLYAIGVGAGLGDPLDELEFTTENSAGVEQQVLPTFGVLVAQARTGRNLGTFDRARLVHAEQAFELHRPLPVAATARVTSTVTGIYDKGSGALVVSENTAVDAASGEALVTSTTSAFIRGEGGFGGDRGPRDAEPWERPERPADLGITQPTRPEQALLYRLSGDRNPLHTDPAFAARGGFATPILHGLCTYGFTGRALLHGVCGGDPARFGSMSARFSQPVLPGETLVTSIWLQDGGAVFQTAKPDGTVVIDRGRMRVRSLPFGRTVRGSCPQAAQQLVEHLLLAVRGDPVGVEHALGAEPVDQDQQLVGRQGGVHPVAQLALLLRLGEIAAQPVREMVELRMLQPAQPRVAQRPAPEADLDLRLWIALLVQRQRSSMTTRVRLKSEISVSR